MMKEMVVKVNCVAAEFRKVSDIQMAETTKRAIRENVSVNQQMNTMSEKTMELLKENERLRKSERELRRGMEVMEDTNKYLARKNIGSERLLGLLKGKAFEQETWSSQLEERIEHFAKLEKEADKAIQEASKISYERNVSWCGVAKVKELGKKDRAFLKQHHICTVANSLQCMYVI